MPHQDLSLKEEKVPNMSKRKIDIEEDEEGDGEDLLLNGEVSTLDRRKHSADKEFETSRNKKRAKIKGHVNFKNVSVYYFLRTQGFTCIPGQGGATLGMAMRHCEKAEFTLDEYEVEKRRCHLMKLRRQRSLATSLHNDSDSEESDTYDSDESEISDPSDSELENYCVQAVPIRHRIAILREAGVAKIDTSEKEECEAIRASREVCGCDCHIQCVADTCSCIQAGIKCQVDRAGFPCGCTSAECINPIGRTEFNAHRVREHYRRTMLRFKGEPSLFTSGNYRLGHHYMNAHSPSASYRQFFSSSNSNRTNSSCMLGNSSSTPRPLSTFMTLRTNSEDNSYLSYDDFPSSSSDLFSRSDNLATNNNLMVTSEQSIHGSRSELFCSSSEPYLHQHNGFSATVSNDPSYSLAVNNYIPESGTFPQTNLYYMSSQQPACPSTRPGNMYGGDTTAPILPSPVRAEDEEGHSYIDLSSAIPIVCNNLTQWDIPNVNISVNFDNFDFLQGQPSTTESSLSSDSPLPEEPLENFAQIITNTMACVRPSS